jgi:hypothetical protein
MTTTTYFTSSSARVTSPAPSRSFLGTIGILWQAFSASLEMARLVDQPGRVTAGQVSQIRAMAERL